MRQALITCHFFQQVKAISNFLVTLLATIVVVINVDVIVVVEASIIKLDYSFENPLKYEGK